MPRQDLLSGCLLYDDELPAHSFQALIINFRKIMKPTVVSRELIFSLLSSEPGDTFYPKILPNML
jgi:hypothetical protein